MRKIFKKIFAVMISAAVAGQMLVFSADADDAASLNDDFAPYTAVVDQFNDYYGTELLLVLTPDSGDDAFETEKQKILSMSGDEFWDYLYELYATELEAEENEEETEAAITTELPDSTNSVNTSVQQRHYYDGTSSNYTYFYMECVTANGSTKYSTLNSCGYHIGAYPARIMTSCSYIITNSARYITITYEYYTRLTAVIENAAIRKDTVTFIAGGDDVWG